MNSARVHTTWSLKNLAKALRPKTRKEIPSGPKVTSLNGLKREAPVPQNPVPSNLLCSNDCGLLSMWLSRFVVETRTKSGRRYPPSTIYQLLTGLLYIMRASKPHCPNFLNKKNPDFKQLHSTLNVHFRRLHEIGLGRKVMHAEVVTKDKLWSQNVMGTTTPRSLLNAVFYLNGKNFCFHGRSIASQFEDLPAAVTFTTRPMDLP